jgi:hypothetical protein
MIWPEKYNKIKFNYSISHCKKCEEGFKLNLQSRLEPPERRSNGVHLVCGFYTAAVNYAEYGGNFADRLLNGETVKDVWFHAIDETHGSDRSLHVIGESSNCRYDHIWGEGSVISDPTVDGTIYYWDFDCS